MPEQRFDRFYRYDDLTRLLHSYAEEYKDLVRLDSLGRSFEGREVWLVTVTAFASGPDREKPAMWVDGNIHSSEVSASSACLYLLDTLVRGYGVDEAITRALTTRAFYICPRVNPDGAEWALADKPKITRSSTRPYPFDEEPIGGLIREDVDGDGRMLTMRLSDPTGNWKACPDEPRLMVRRDPGEEGGQYYRLLPEGRIDDYDGALIRLQMPKYGLDINRNFPAGWKQEYQQPGAGPFPVSEPEIRCIVDFMVAHPNLTGGVAFHTYSGVLLRPHSDRADDSFDAEDLLVYKKIGAKGTALTGYPAISIFHDFRYGTKDTISGGLDAFMYDYLGVFFFAVELWSPQRQAGIVDFKYIDWFREHPVEDDLAMLRWNDLALDGKGYVDWYRYEHPQLGPLEIGGWHHFYAFRNPPPHLLEAEIATFPPWLVWQLLLSPLLEIYSASISAFGESRYKVRLVVQNAGWLPTYVTKKAVATKVVRGVVCEITLPPEATLELGLAREERGQLEGRAYPQLNFHGPADPTDNRLAVEWVVCAPNGGTIEVLARHDRAGVARVRLDILRK
jgi:murein tripeptide amidase MpaA